MRRKYPQYANASDESDIGLGRAICGDLRNGAMFVEVGLQIIKGNSLTARDGGYIAGIAIGALCPEFKHLISN